ncbi:MAG: helix-turn-helix domain-containing protein [Clostridiales bacterium]|nr:helix-turn-helix domain-containing protein [Clostridiales bacterium]
MNFAEKLKTLRKQYKFSQEQLAEKLNVSRQAITKWETDGGLPDIDNLMAIAALFSLSMDDLLSDEKLAKAQQGFAYESVTEHDIRSLTHFDIHAPAAFEITVTSTPNEKLRVCLASSVMQTLEKDYKVQIDEHRRRLDVDIRRMGNASDTAGKEALHINISLPASLCEEVELAAATQSLRLIDADFSFELDGKAGKVFLAGRNGKIALNCNTDMDIYAEQLPAALEINQINAVSALHIPKDAMFTTKTKGKSNKIIFPNRVEHQSDGDAENLIELAGMNAELTVTVQ